MTENTNTEKGLPAQVGKTLQGVVIAGGSIDTTKVAVSRFVKHPKYKKFIKKVKKYLVHDVGNTASVGDKVTIQETKPISKNKHFKLVK